MSFPDQALLENRRQILQFEASQQLALETDEDENEYQNRRMPIVVKTLTAAFVAFGLVILADQAFYDGRHVQWVIGLFRHIGAAVGIGH
jgi:hypothetical protein